MDEHINQRLDWHPDPALMELSHVPMDLQRRGMRHLAMGVTVVTTAAEGRRGGLTATAVASVTVAPPRLVVFINKNCSATALILDGGALCVNVLAGDQETVARGFAGMIEGVAGDERFQLGSWSLLATEAPALDRALANMDCRVIKVFDESTHHAFLCEVLAVRERDKGDALVYLDGRFHALSQ